MSTEINNNEFNPFNSIALCISGGGYRAAAFGLGALSMFNQLGLLDKIEAISTVSGGTITGVKYVDSLIEERSFQEFYNGFFHWMKEDSLLEKAISNLESGKVWKRVENRHKRRNLINSFALVYRELSKHTIDDLNKVTKTHLNRVVFNASDFEYGQPFRFQKRSGTEKLGNYFSPWDLPADKIYLSDVLAASSCFPGGFEPMRFPGDFYRPDKGDDYSITLMDGGITDNQGISSFFTNSKSEKYNLYFVADVSSPYIKTPFRHRENFLLSLLGNLLSIWIVFPLIVICLLLFYLNWNIAFTALFTITFILILLRTTIDYLLANFLSKKGIKNKYPKIPLRYIPQYALDRLNSLLSMSNDVFLKSGRRAAYNNLYNEDQDDLRGKRITGTIYELRCERDFKSGRVEGKPEGMEEDEWIKLREKIGEIPESFKEIAKQASDFPTVLWFTEEQIKNDDLTNLVLCGQITTCFNIMSLIVSHYSGELTKGGMIRQIWDSALDTWRELSKNKLHIHEDVILP